MTPFDQHIHELLFPYGPLADSAARLLLAGVIGGLVGLEREVRGRQAGFRTNMLVCMGSCLVMLVSLSVPEIASQLPSMRGVNINADPARIAYGVMTGIGFLGAGAILQRKDSIRGLTTAAALWCVAGLGLAAGLGLYSLTTMTGLAILFTLWVLDIVEDAIPKRRFRRITIRGTWAPGCTKDAIDWMTAKGVRVNHVSLKREPEETYVDFTLLVGFMTTAGLQRFERDLQHNSPYQLLEIDSLQ